MRHTTRFLLALSLALPAGAQVTPIGAFGGDFDDDFESQALQTNVPCIQERVFGGRADLCSAFGESASIVDAASAPAGILPQSGTQLFHADVLVDLVFDRPVRRFGAWFASPWVGAGSATFFDAAGVVIASESIAITPCSTSGCAWTWNGWDLGAGSQVTVIRLDTATGTGGHFELEDLQLDLACGAASTYCTAKTNSQGCAPAIGSTGAASASAGGGFVIGATQVLNQKTGLVFYGTNGRASVPFQGGWRCVALPLARTPLQSSGGSASGADCSGSFAFDFNARIASGVDPALVAGTTVDAQYWSRDPGFAPPNNTSLTDAIEFGICP